MPDTISIYLRVRRDKRDRHVVDRKNQTTNPTTTKQTNENKIKQANRKPTNRNP